MTTVSRAGELAMLEAHLGRQFALTVRDECREALLALDRGHDPAETLRLMCGYLSEQAAEHRKIMDAARHVPDQILADYVRVYTSPMWVAHMRDLGFVWDDERLHWRKS